MKLSDLKSYSVVGSGTAASLPAKPQKDALQTASDVGDFLFPGTKKIGESLTKAATNIGNLATGGVDKLMENAEDNRTDIAELGGAYTAAGASALGTAGVGATGGVLRKALESAGLGALMAGGREASEGGSVEDVTLASAGGAATGAAVSGAFSGAESVLKSFRALPERLIRSATGQSKTELVKGKDISKYVLENKRVGTAEDLIRSAQEAIDEADTFINQSLDSVTDRNIPLKDIIGDVTESINAAGGDVDDVAVRSVLESLAPQVKKTLASDTLTLSQANRLRSQLDKILGNRAFISAQLPFNKGILMDVSNSLREQVKGTAPDGVRQAFETYAKELKLRDLLIAKTAGGSRNQMLGLGDIMTGLGGSVIGGGVVGGLGAAALRRAGESTIAKTGGAVLINKLDDTLSPILTGLEPSARTAVINALVSAFSELGNQD